MNHDTENQEIAELLGWTEIHRIEDGWDKGGLAGKTPEGDWKLLGDCLADLNEVVVVLEHYDATLRLDFGPAYAAGIIPEGRINERKRPQFWEHSSLVDKRLLTIQELAGMVLLQFLRAYALKP